MTKEAKNRAVCKELSAKVEALNKLKKEVDDLKAYLRVETGEVTTDFGTWLVTFSDRKTDTVDVKRLKAEMPEVFAEYGKVSEAKILKVKAK